MAKRERNKLTPLEVTRLAKPGRYSDGEGLYVVVDDQGRKRWVFRYRMGSTRRDMGLGAAAGPGAVGLADARVEAEKAREKQRRGVDPIADREAQNAKTAAQKKSDERESSTPTFGTYADAYVDRHQSAWRNDKHVAQWKATLKGHCHIIRERRIDEVDTAAVLSVLQPIWSKVPETAQRLRGRIERVLDAARVEGHRTGENPARWRGHLQALLPKRQKLTRGHHAALPYGRLNEFMAALRGREALSARLLEFCILTATRSGEAFNATWDEIDMDRAVWTIPAARMKAGREHRVPLSARAIAILKEAAHVTRGRYVFPGQGDAPLSNMAMAQTLKRMGFGHFTVHGFRSTFRDWAAETTPFPQEVCEMALAHTIQNKAEAAYRRGDLLERRKELMTAWASFCEPRAAENVVEMRRSA